MEKAKLDIILGKHEAWTRNETGGERADLRGADLGTLSVIQIGPIGSRQDYLVMKYGPAIDEVMAGCWRGTLAEFEGAVEETHSDNKHGRKYKAAIVMIKTLRKGVEEADGEGNLIAEAKEKLLAKQLNEQAAGD